MIIPDKKRVTTIILSRLNGKGGESRMPVKPEADVSESKDENEPLTIAAQDVMQAFHDKSILSLRDSLKAFVELCGGSESDESGE